MKPKFYYKTVPVLNANVYRLADLVNNSSHILLPGEATMYQGTDFVGRVIEQVQSALVLLRSRLKFGTAWRRRHATCGNVGATPKAQVSRAQAVIIHQARLICRPHA